MKLRSSGDLIYRTGIGTHTYESEKSQLQNFCVKVREKGDFEEYGDLMNPSTRLFIALVLKRDDWMKALGHTPLSAAFAVHKYNDWWLECAVEIQQVLFPENVLDELEEIKRFKKHEFLEMPLGNSDRIRLEAFCRKIDREKGVDQLAILPEHEQIFCCLIMGRHDWITNQYASVAEAQELLKKENPNLHYYVNLGIASFADPRDE